MKNLLKKTKGITLIALVVTIVVLLILAGITITSLTGDKSIIKEARSAAESAEYKALEEQIEAAIIVAEQKYGDNTTLDRVINEIMKIDHVTDVNRETGAVTSELGYVVEGKLDDYLSQGDTPTPPTPPAEEKVEVGKKVEKTEKDNYTDNDGDTATVPKDFAIVPGCEDISEGLVISDVENDTANTGNQFVWVPVDPSKFERISGYYSKKVQTITTSYTEPYASGYENEASEHQEMCNHVKNYKGFYIGRYEAGKDASGNVVVKKGASVYNNIPWGNAMNNISNTSGKVGAVKLSKDFATNNGYTDVTSTLCYGVQWDAVMQFMDSNYSNGVYDANSYVKDSSNKGWYSNNYNSTTNGNTVTNPNHQTGIDLIYNSNSTIITNKQKNIYDMAGNVNEWTMEACNTSNRVYRGGTYSNDGSDRPASMRYYFGPADNGGDYIGFRFALYL